MAGPRHRRGWWSILLWNAPEVYGECMIKRNFEPDVRIALRQRDLNLALQGGVIWVFCCPIPLPARGCSTPPPTAMRPGTIRGHGERAGDTCQLRDWLARLKRRALSSHRDRGLRGANGVMERNVNVRCASPIATHVRGGGVYRCTRSGGACQFTTSSKGSYGRGWRGQGSCGHGPCCRDELAEDSAALWARGNALRLWCGGARADRGR